ncbi:MAG: S-layer homology domain-containing protein, partial [Candidatus Sericytochromatia bacterium]
MAIPFALAVVLASQTASWANTTHDETTGGGGGTTESTSATTRAEAAIQAPTDVMVADLPGGHWATNATQWAVANNILALENGQFMGNEELSSADLNQAMESLVNIAETIQGKGALPDLRAAIGTIPTTDAAVTRIQIAQTLARFLDVAKSHQLLALGAITPSASGFKDLGTQVPAAVTKVVDQYGVMTGYKEYTFKPQEQVTRYQM